jgi:hypothetical protein
LTVTVVRLCGVANVWCVDRISNDWEQEGVGVRFARRQIAWGQP